MEKRHEIDEEVYNFVRSNFDKSYIQKYSTYNSVSKNYSLSIYISNVKSGNKISVNISKKNESGFKKNESYTFSDRYSKLIRHYFEDRSDSDNQDYIRNKNESILTLIKNIEDE